MNYDLGAMNQQADRVFLGQWRFQNIPVSQVDDAGQPDGFVGARDFPASQIGVISQNDFNGGDFSLTLMSGNCSNNLPVSIGKSPYISG